MSERAIYGFLRSFPKGINSDIDPLLLPPDQLSFSQNATMRGDFVRPRPPYKYLPLTVSDSVSDFDSGLFQGAAYYRDQTGEGFIMMAVNGALFKVAINSDSTCSVSEIKFNAIPANGTYDAAGYFSFDIVAGKSYILTAGANERLQVSPATINGKYSLNGDIVQMTQFPVGGVVSIPSTTPETDSANHTIKVYLNGLASTNSNTYNVTATCYEVSMNSTTQPLNWMWQAERFLIWNDGVNLPVFYDGQKIRRSFGSDFKKIASTTAAFTIPAIGNSIKVPINNSIPANFWNSAVLLAQSKTQAAQMVLQSVSTDTVQGSMGVDSIVLQSVSGDNLANAATVNMSSQYCGWILRGGVVQDGLAISDWGVVKAPDSAKQAQQITINLPTGRLLNADKMNDCANWMGLFDIPCPPAVSVGDVIKIGGHECTVVSLSSPNVRVNGGAAMNSGGWSVTKMVVTPKADYSGAITGAIDVENEKRVQNSNYEYVGWVTGIPSGAYVCKKTGRIFKTGFVMAPAGSVPNSDWTYTTSDGSPNWGSSGSAPAPNYFTVTLNQTPSGLKQLNTRYIFSVKGVYAGTYTQDVTFSGYVSGKQLINCQLTSNVASLNTIIQELDAGVLPQSMLPIVQMVSEQPTITSVGTVYNASYTGLSVTFNPLTVTPIGSNLVINIETAGSSRLEAGQILTCVPSIGSGLDIFVVKTAVSVSGSSQYYATLTNQTGTEGALIPSSTEIFPVPEIPVSNCGCYGGGRNWVALPDGVSFLGGDLIGGASGSNVAPDNYNFEDAVLKISENAMLAGGTTFKVPSSGDRIRAMQFAAVMDASLGQGALQVFTDSTVFSCQAPADISTWSSMTSPILVESLIGSGGISPNAVVQNNSDLLFRLSNGGVQSMLMARLDFNKWGNTPISKEVSRSIQDDDPKLLPHNTMTVFNNRMFVGCKPVQSARGVYHPSFVSLNFDPTSSLAGKSPSLWEGEWDGLNVLQFVTGFFGGVIKCFAICLSSDLSKIQINELMMDNYSFSDYNEFDNSVPIFLEMESPMLFSQDESHHFKRLSDGEIYIDKIAGDVSLIVYYKSDQNSDWTFWYGAGIKQMTGDNNFRPRVGIGQPSASDMDAYNNRPMREGYNFQVKILASNCRVLGGRFMANIIPEPRFAQPK